MNKSVLLVFLSLIVTTACGNRSETGGLNQIRPEETTVGPEISLTAKPDFSPLTELLRREGQVNSLLISRNGSVIYRYGDSGGNYFYNFYSVTKSVTALLAGIAIEQEYLENESVLVSDYLSFRDNDPLKNRMELRHLLAMTSGFQWSEISAGTDNLGGMIRSDDWVRYVTGRDMAAEPGAVFNYNTGNFHLAGKIVEEATSMSLADFAEERLFSPLGIEDVRWHTDPQGIDFGGAWIRMSPEDALKIGQLVLNNGEWNGRRIVSEEWLETMLTEQSPGYRWDDYVGGEYGYGWWLNNYRGYRTVFAWGAYEQYIFVTPELELVAVFNSTYVDNEAARPPEIYAEYVLEAVLEAEGLGNGNNIP